MTSVRALSFLLAMIALTGCTSVKRSYSGHPPEQVWMAMKTAAAEPRSPDWHIRANNLWIDEDARRIEIERHLHRELFMTADRTRFEEQSWKFQIRLRVGIHPVIEFTSRALAVPAQARLEAERYFDDVADLLSAVPTP
jgi:hypothetical protein